MGRTKSTSSYQEVAREQIEDALELLRDAKRSASTGTRLSSEQACAALEKVGKLARMAAYNIRGHAKNHAKS